MERLGHSSIRVTLDTYSHIVGGLQEVAAQRFDDFLSANGGPGENVGKYVNIVDKNWGLESGWSDLNRRPPEPHIASRKGGDRLPPFIYVDSSNYIIQHTPSMENNI